MRYLFALLRLSLIAIFVAGLALPDLGCAADHAMPAAPQTCAAHAGHGSAAPDLHKAAAACLEHCLASSLTPEPVLPAARAERVSTLTPPARLPLAALRVPAPEAPPPRA
ncbi:hypothetical protein C8J30_12215 [Rhodobacter viridis]|uniref:Uncharacterized protein n=1 Tax=Rhodobacter viridis TaxID=1054202 RepID=A0A318TQ59_9RHOB|nr:hypothetical protein [Rhodobacter viridis]PYF06932.1 hypothetical protein C8J30_12215 [Rhodobacter viridis]